MAMRSFLTLRGGRDSKPVSGGSKHILSAGRTSVCKVPSQVRVSHIFTTREKKPRELRDFNTYANTNQDHLDVAEHLRDSNDHVEHDRHELRETGHP